ncbi:MAG: hypothetical protein R3D55_09645 [Chloroflexota bacterium]
MPTKPRLLGKSCASCAFQEAGQLNLGFVPSLLTAAQRHFLSTTKPEEELYDLQADPHETHNLATDPTHTADLQRLRDALAHWHAEYPDLGLIPNDLLQTWRPDGQFSQTAPPELTVEAGQVTATCSTEGAVIGWTAVPPAPRTAENSDFLKNFGNAVGKSERDGRSWQLYTGAIGVGNGRTPLVPRQSPWLFRQRRSNIAKRKP